MKIYIVENVLEYFYEKWPQHFYLADFILSQMINYPTFYYNYNYPDWFSLNGKEGDMCYIYDFITCVANVPGPGLEKPMFRGQVVQLVKNGAPSNLFNDYYLKE